MSVVAAYLSNYVGFSSTLKMASSGSAIAERILSATLSMSFCPQKGSA